MFPSTSSRETSGLSENKTVSLGTIKCILFVAVVLFDVYFFVTCSCIHVIRAIC